jgi:uncharacterized protein (TIGR03435 family)
VPLLQALLEARFQVKVHREARESPAYLLTLARDGSKMPLTREGSCTPFDLSNLQPPAPPKPGEPLPRFCGAGGERTKDGSLTVADWYGVTMAELAGRMLSGAVDHPVIDRTALTGRFDVHLEYVRDRQGSGPVMLNGSVTAELPAPPPDSAGPSIFAALEKQLGLKLSPGKAPLDVVLVDHAEKPTAN